MALFAIAQDLLPDENDFSPVDPVKWNEIILSVQDAVNNLNSANIVIDTLARNKIKGGAVSTGTEVSSTGEANKVIKLDATGDLNLDGSLKFKRE